MKKVIILFLVICFVMYAECMGESSVDANSINALVTGNNDFALGLYRKLKDDSKGNLFFSPYSISSALAMAYSGADADTKKQMATVLHFTLSDEQLYPAFGALQKQIIQMDKSSGSQILMANALWLQKSEPFLIKFLNLTAFFDAGRFQVDFVNEMENARQKINSWVEEQTKNEIVNLITPKGIDSETVMVISNAVYFIGEWKSKFNVVETQDADFYASTKKTVNTHLMHQNESFKYYADKTLQAVEMPYKGDALSIVVVLPIKKQGLKEIEKTLAVKMLNDLLSKMVGKEVDIYLPKFKINWGTFSLNESLKALGMTEAFVGGKADFSGINGNKNLFISDVFHKAFVEVNEEGTEATASTAVVFSKAIHHESIVFYADHPFMFIIRDNRSGSILFMGRLMNPVVQE